MRKFFFLIFVVVSLNAKIVHFQEEKYIEVVDNTFYKKGTLEFNTDSIKLQYQNRDKVLVYNNDTLTLLDGEKKEEINPQAKILLKIIFQLIDAVYKNDLETLKEFFSVKKNGDNIVLEPKENAAGYINTISFSKKDDKLQYLTIDMKNGNKTTIRQIDE